MTPTDRSLAPEPDSIAIIGLACRLPGAVAVPADLWDLLTSGRDPIGPIPSGRWSTDAYYSPDRNLPGRAVSREGGFLEGVELFDPEPFGLSPAEAPYLDPQQRLLLLGAAEALAAAGLESSGLAGQEVGVFIGAFTCDYLRLQLADLKKIDGQTSVGSMGTMLSNRLSHCFDFRGPSLTVDTACSSSLTALHLACRSLRRKECSLALAGGVQLLLSPEITLAESRTGFLSPTGRCRSFSALADGYVRSEGMGLALLKPLDRALADGDPIEAVIRGSAVNQDGRTGTITLPNPEAQIRVIQAAARDARIEPGQIDYLEAHGTGTPMGDPVEALAAGRALRTGPGVGRPLLVGAVKANIGHCEAASGMAGLIKAVICLKHRLLPPNLHSAPLSPHIPFDELGLKVAVKAEELPGGPILAGINSFGFGGSNAHLVLENFDSAAPRQARRPWNLRKFWHEPRAGRLRRERPGFGQFPGERVDGPGTAWLLELTETDFPWLLDHRVAGGPLLPAAATVALMWAAAALSFPGQGFSLREVKLLRAQPVVKGRPVQLRVSLNEETLTLKVSRSGPGECAETVLARSALRSRPPGGAASGPEESAAAARRCPLTLERAELYAAFNRLRFDYQGDFQLLDSVALGRGEALGFFRPPPPVPGLDFHPAALDAALQVLLSLIIPEVEGVMTPVPAVFKEIRLTGPLTGNLSAHARLEECRAQKWLGRVSLYDQTGRLAAEINGVELQNPAAVKVPKKSPLTVAALKWRPAALPPENKPGRQSWLICGLPPDFGQKLSAALKAGGQHLPGWPEGRRRNWPLDLAQCSEEDVAALVQNLPRADRLLWFIPPALKDPQDCGRVCLSLVRLLRALAGLDRLPRLLVFTCSALDLGSAEPRPWAAAVWGLMRVLAAAELPALKSGLVDLELDLEAEELAAFLLDLAGREKRDQPREDQWAVRQGRVYVPRLELVNGVDGRELQPVLRKEPWYILTGALGDLGRLCVQWLRRRGAARILILGRRPVSELSRTEAAFIKKLGIRGSRVSYEKANLSDPEALDLLLRGYRADGGLGGLIHLAAHSEPQTWRNLSPEAFDRVFAAKAVSAWNLHQALLDDPLDHFLLFSSLSSLWGLPGMGAYGAANAFLDSLAELRRRKGLCGLSLGWGPWSLGLAGRDRRSALIFKNHGLEFFDRESGPAALEKLFNRLEPHLLPLIINAGRLAAGPLARKAWMADLVRQPEIRTQNGPRPEPADILKIFQSEWARVIPGEPAGPDMGRPLIDQGLDSLNSLMLAYSLSMKLGQEITPDILLRPETPRELAGVILLNWVN